VEKRSFEEVHAKNQHMEAIDDPFAEWVGRHSSDEVFRVIYSIAQRLVEDQKGPDPMIVKLAKDMNVSGDDLKEFFLEALEANGDAFHEQGKGETWDANPALEYAKMVSEK